MPQLCSVVTAIINPRRACAARVTVVVLCVRMYVCMCVHSNLPPHTLELQNNTGIVLNFADFPKNASFKSYGVICLPRAGSAS